MEIHRAENTAKFTLAFRYAIGGAVVFCILFALKYVIDKGII